LKYDGLCGYAIETPNITIDLPGGLMSSRARLAAVLVSGLVLRAWAAQPEIPYDRSQAGNIKTIGVLTLPMPSEPTIWLASDSHQMFGLVGALVEQNHRDAAFWNAMRSIGGEEAFPAPALLAALSSALGAAGFAVKQVPVARPDGKFLRTYPKADGGVDAFLDIAFEGYGYGYVAAGRGTPFRPYVYLRCRLVRASDGATLMQDAVLYNPINAPNDAVVLSPNPSYEFTNFESLDGDPRKAVAGMDDAVENAASTIGGLLLLAGGAPQAAVPSPPPAASTVPCRSAPDLTDASRLAYDSGKHDNRVTIEITQASPCLKNPGGSGPYATYQLPVVSAPYLIRVSSEPQGNTLLALRVLMYGADGGLEREFSGKQVVYRGNALSVLFRSHDDERYLVIASDPVAAGEGVSRVQAVTHDNLIWGPRMSFSVPIGRDVRVKNTLSLTGRVVVSLEPLPGN
jgi:hypothetical protein